MFNTLNTERLKQITPSVFTENSAQGTSDKYQHISTAKIVDALLTEGFMPTQATQCNCRKSDNKAYTKHLLRFRHTDARPTPSGLYPEIVLINSHDGLSSYRLMAGIYRIVCSNGLVAGNFYNEIRVRHQGNIVNEVIEGSYSVIEDSRKMIESAEKMSSIKLSIQEKIAFAEATHAIRFDNSPVSDSIDPSKLLTPRRFEEMNKDDLFTLFNVAQENIIKGGVRGYAVSPNRRPKRISTRAINSIDQNITLNRALWSLAENMMQQRGVH